MRARTAALAALSLGLVGALVTIPTSQANAASIPQPGGGTVTTRFEIDASPNANVTVDGTSPTGGVDWNNVSSAFAATPYLTSQNYPSTGIMAATFIGDPCPDTTTDTTSMGGSLNDNPWIIDSNAPNAKADLCSYGAAYELVNVDGQNHAILYAAVSRYSEGTGDLVVYQELKGTEPGRCDDKLIAFDYHSGGGGGVTVYVYTWTGSCAVNGTGSWVLSDPGGYQAAFGVNPISTDSNKGTFGETAVDLTAMGVLPENQCKTFTTGAVISQTGNSATATLQDIIIPAAADTITINNCSSLKVTKVANGPVPSGTTFTYQILQNDLHPVGQSVHAPVLAVDSTTAAPVYTLDTVNFGDGAVVQIDAKIAVGETHTWSNVMAEPDYLVKEVLPTTPGVSLKSISCVAFDRFGIQTSPIVIYENGAYTGDTFPIFPSSTGILPPVCTITNQVTALTLNKVLPNDNGGTKTGADFVLSATPAAGGAAVINKADPAVNDPAVGASALVTAGTYTLAETPASTTGYTTSAWTCVDGATGASVSVSATKQVTIAEGQNVVCSITNDDIPAKLTLVKTVTNDNGGTAAASAWTLSATGPVTLSGPTGTSGDVSAGTYTLSESGGPAGYTAGTWSCALTNTPATPVTVTSGAVSLTLGQDVTCTINNNDQTSTLVLDKVLTNDNGGTATSDQFVLTATGTAGTPAAATTSSGGDTNPAAGSSLSFTVNAGEYTLSEAQLAGYTAGTWTCTGATLTGTTLVIPNGVTVTCTITNDDMPASLTLTKGVVNDDGGNATAEDFELTATLGETKVSGWGSASGEGLAAGTYTLSESSVPGYAAGDWSCTITDAGGTQTTSSGPSVTVPNGGSGACSIVNDDKAVDLVLTKDDGGITGTVGMTFPYTITVTNAGERPADLNEPVLVADLLPVGLEVVSVPSTCVATGSEIDCVIDPAALPAGGSVTLTLTVKFAANAAAGTYTNLAVVTTDDDPAPENPTCPAPEAVAKVGALLAPLAVTADPSNNVDCEETPLTPIYGLTLVKAGFEVSGTTWTATDGVVNFGDTVGYSIRATAGGNAQQTMVTVTDVVPTGMTFTPGSNVCLDGVVCTTAYDAATRTLSWTVATLQPGGSFVASFQATVDAAPTVAPGETYAWTGTNVAAVVSKENPKVPSNEVTVKSSKSELPKTGADGLGLAYLGLLLAALGGGLVLVARRRRDEEETA